MRPLDFLKRDASTPLRRQYLAAGAVFEISTNSESILDVAGESFLEMRANPAGPSWPSGCRLRFWVDPAATSGPPWPNPYFRGLDHLVFAGFDPQNSLLVNLGSKQVIGRFSPALAADRAYWKSIIFPVLLTLTGATLGIAELHCACVSLAGEGLLLAGASGSGKSTLTLALARAGFRFLSDDRTYLSRRAGELAAWGLPTRLKLRPEAAVYFPELRGLEPRTALNGERAFELDLEGDFHWTRAARSDPRRLIFLERLDSREPPAFELTELDPAEAAARLAADLLPETPEAAAAQRQVIDELVRRPVYRLRYSGDPPSVARALIEWFAASGGSTVSPQESSGGGVSAPPSDGATTLRSANPITSGEARRRADPPRKNPDPLRRFLPTPLAVDLPLMGRTVRLETNSAAVRSQTERLLARYRNQAPGDAQFRWRIIREADSRLLPPWPQAAAFSDSGLGYVSFGQHSFLAVDLEARQAAAFLAAGLAHDPAGFSSPFLDRLLVLTAGALGLTSIGAACVASGGRGLLIFGSSRSGKTTSSYLATRLGLEFHDDQAVLLDLEAGALRAWRGCWPAAFRSDAKRFAPELDAVTQPFPYGDETFLYLNGQAADSHPPFVIPACSVFLEREAAAPARLRRLARAEYLPRLGGCLLFKDDPRFESQQAAALAALARLPAYHLAYGSDPADAAAFFPALLEPQALKAAP